jgi:hypothetical protein
MNKFNIDDIVEIIKGKSVWYTHLDDLREKKIGKRGTIVSIEKQIFTKEDLLWAFGTYSSMYRLARPDYEQITYSYMIKFPDEPKRLICFSEVNLQPII